MIFKFFTMVKEDVLKYMWINPLRRNYRVDQRYVIDRFDTIANEGKCPWYSIDTKSRGEF